MHFPHQPELRQEPESLLKPEKQKRSQSCAALAVPRGIVYETRICIVSLRLRLLRERRGARRHGVGSRPFVSRVEEESQDEGGRSRRVPPRGARPSAAAPLSRSAQKKKGEKGGSRSKERRGPRRLFSQTTHQHRHGETARSPPRLGLLGSGVLQLIAHETKSDSHSLRRRRSEPLRLCAALFSHGSLSGLTAVESESSKYANFVSTNLVSMDCQ